MKSERLLLLAVLFAPLIGGCDSHAYHEEAMRYMAETERVLDEEGLCFDKRDCGLKGMVFWSAGGWKIGPIVGGRVTINVHNVSDAAVAEKIIQRCQLLHSQIPSVPVTVTVFKNAHIDNLHPGTPVIVKKAQF